VIQPHSADVKIEGASIGARWLVVRQRSRAQQSVVLHKLPQDGSMPQQLGDGQVVQFEEAAYALSGGELWLGMAFLLPLVMPAWLVFRSGRHQFSGAARLS
jgi:hypothetical protein